MDKDTKPIWVDEDPVHIQPGWQPGTQQGATHVVVHETPSTVPNQLGLSIFNTLCCCLCLGIIAIVYSSEANSLRYVNPDEARRKAITARNLNIAGIITGAVILTVTLIVYVVLLTTAMQ